MLDGLKHRAAQQAVAVVQGADLSGCQGTLGLGVFEFGAALAQRAEGGIAGGAAVAGLGLQQALIVQR